MFYRNARAATVGALVLAILSAAALLAGCGGDGGGNGGGNNPAMIQNAAFQITWPARSRAAVEHNLSSALSVMVTLKGADANGQDVTVAIDRDASKTSSYTATYQVGKPIRTSTSSLSATFFGAAAEQGAPVGTATAAILASDSNLVLANIVVQGVIKSVGVISPGTVTVGTQNTQLQFTSLDGGGHTVAVSAGSATWTVVTGGAFLTLTKDGLATAVASGTATVTATVDGISSPAANIVVSSTSATVAYRLVPIPVSNLSGFNFHINASNEVVGSWVDGTFTTHAFAWTQASGVTQLSAGSFQFSNDGTSVQTLNDAGQIIGTGIHRESGGGGFQPAFWPSSGSAPVEPKQIFGSGNLNAGQTGLLGINNSGAMVGETQIGFVTLYTDATYWSSPDATPVNLAKGSATGAVAFAINAGGGIVGALQSTDQPDSPRHACIWANASAQPVLLKELPGSTSSQAVAVNASGGIVGFGFQGAGAHALLWNSTADAPIDLGVFSDNIYALVSNNDAGAVVWTSPAGPAIYTPAGGIKVLGGLLDASGNGYTLLGASGINATGSILAVAKNPGGSTVLVVLIPTP